MSEIDTLKIRRSISAMLIQIYSNEFNILKVAEFDDDFSIDKILFSSDYIEIHFRNYFDEFRTKIFTYEELLPRILQSPEK